MAFNPVTALTGATLGELGTLPEMVDLLRAIFARVRGGRRAARDHASRCRWTGGWRPGLAVGDHKTSMLQDLEAGKRLELDCMTGRDRSSWPGGSDVDVPHVRTVHACAKLLDQLSQASGTSAG